MERVCQTLGVSERRACRVLRQYRSTQRHRTLTPQDEPRLVTRTLQLAGEYGRYGYRRITALLRREGWRVNHKRVERIWRQEGLKVPKKQPRKSRLWLNDGSCLRLRPCWRDHVWAYDFVADRTQDGRPLKMLTVVDEYTRECLAIDVERRADSMSVLERLAALFVERGVPDYIRSDNGSEFHSTVGSELAGAGRGKDLVHRAGEPMGKRVCRIVEREVSRRVSQWGDLLHLAGSEGVD